MYGKHLIARVAPQIGLSKAQTALVIHKILEEVINIVAKEGSLRCKGFGSLEVRDRKARDGHNPGTGEKIRIKACKTVCFRPSRAFKERL